MTGGDGGGKGSDQEECGPTGQVPDTGTEKRQGNDEL